MKTWRQTVLSQFASSPRLTSLLAAIDAWISPDANFEAFFNYIWNVDTAEGYGLDIWGRIVVIPRVVSLANTKVFGFAEATDRANFGGGPFYSGTLVSENFTLTDSVYRQFILAKAAFNITNGSIPAINAIMLNLFPNRGNAYVVDGLNMSMIYHFDFILEPFEQAIVQSGVLPRPAGVSATVVYPGS